MAEHLDSLGITPAKDFGFIPHITISTELTRVKQFPRIVYLEAPVLWWGNDRKLHSNHRKEEAA
jgi:hypothetical protein